MEEELNIYRIKNSFLMRHQLYAMREYGNTIVSKNYSEEEIIQEFLNFGIKVRVHEMSYSSYIDVETHYLVERINKFKNVGV